MIDVLTWGAIAVAAWTVFGAAIVGLFIWAALRRERRAEHGPLAPVIELGPKQRSRERRRRTA